MCTTSHRNLLQRQEKWDKARGIRKKKTREKDRGKVRCGRMNRLGGIQRQTLGKRPTCAGGYQDRWKERNKGRKRDEGEGESKRKTGKNSPSVKMPES